MWWKFHPIWPYGLKDICIQSWTKRVFSRRCVDCPKTLIVPNFLIFSSNSMNKSFTCTQKYNLLGKKHSKKLFWLSVILLCFPPKFVFHLLCHNFCSWAPLEIKIMYPWSSYWAVQSWKKIQEHTLKIETIGTYPDPICPLRVQMVF